MKKYNMIDKRDRNVREELKEYTLEELKEFFSTNEDCEEGYSNIEKMKKVQDIDDLIELLKEEAAGMEMPYEFEEVGEVANTYGYGKMELLTEDEPYKRSLDYNDAEIDGITYAVGCSEETGKIVEIREREDGSMFAVLIDA